MNIAFEDSICSSCKHAITDMINDEIVHYCEFEEEESLHKNLDMLRQGFKCGKYEEA